MAFSQRIQFTLENWKNENYAFFFLVLEKKNPIKINSTFFSSISCACVRDIHSLLIKLEFASII